MAGEVELRGQVRGQKTLLCCRLCCRLTSLAHDTLWEFGTGREPINLNLPSGFKKLCPASHWPVDRGGGKMWVVGGFHVWQRALGQILLAMEVKKGRSSGDFGNCRGGVRGLGAVNRVTDFNGLTV